VTELKILLEYYSPDVPSLVESAAFYKSNVADPFVAVEDISGLPSLVNRDDAVKLEPAISPETATKQKVIWSIVGFLDKGQADVAANWLTIKGKPDGNATEKANYTASKAALLAKVDFKTVTIEVTPDEKYMDYSVYPPEEKTAAGTGVSYSAKSADTIIAAATGKVKVQALILGGGADEEDYTQIFTIQVEKESAQIIVALNSAEGVGATVTATSNSYTVDNNGTSYGNAYGQFPVTFTTGKTLADVANIYFDIVGVSGDINWKTALLLVNNTKYTGWVDQDNVAIAKVTNALGEDGTVAATGQKFAIDASKVETGENDAASVWMIIMYAGDGTAKYTVSNVKLTYWE